MKEILADQKSFFDTNKTKDYEFRISQLHTLKKLIIDHQKEIEDALYKDLNKSAYEAYSTEIGFSLHSISKMIKKLKKWMKPKKISTPLHLFMTKSYMKYEPLGSVLIIGPFNYPFQLVIEPLIGAIASGNCVVVKPSEYAVHTEALLFRLINETFDKKYIYCITGGKEVVSELIHLPFNHIFFTGSTHVGKIVYQAAATNLVPVTLELGGKSPTIVDQSVPLDITARRIVFGKFLNAGQTCIAPDYVYVHQDVEEKFIEELVIAIKDFYPSIEEHYGKIISQNHFERLQNLIDQKNVVYGQVIDENNMKIGPTIMNNVSWDDTVMKEEIFGPILPILTYKKLDDVIHNIKTNSKPLALYLFSKDKDTQKRVFNELSFGGGAINDTIMHIVNGKLPFGGVGASGIGEYHGYASFTCFSNRKSYVKKSTLIDLPIAYPPYTKFKSFLLRKFLK